VKKKRQGTRQKSRARGGSYPRFGRAILPRERFHTTKKGARGYSRKAQKEQRMEGWQ
jgi:hypothetical protein